jgi:branched-chain amino acid transport system permease protein
VLAIWVDYGLDVSHAGLRLKATRDDEFAARSIGISIARARFSGFALSALLVGVGGALYAHLLGAFSPADFYLDTTFVTIVMLVVGGMRSLTGAVVGTIVVSAIQELLEHVESGINLGLIRIPARPGVTQVGLAVVVLVILVFRPNGITGGRELPFPAARRRSTSEVKDAIRRMAARSRSRGRQGNRV